jgi:hypothetical protein
MMSAAAHTAGNRNTQYKWLNWSSVRSMIVFEAFVIIVMYPNYVPSNIKGAPFWMLLVNSCVFSQELRFLSPARPTCSEALQVGCKLVASLDI